MPYSFNNRFIDASTLSAALVSQMLL